LFSIMYKSFKTAVLAAVFLFIYGFSVSAAFAPETSQVEVGNKAAAIVKSIKMKWFGHAMFLLELNDTKILIDPFSDIGYPMPKDPVRCEACVVSHGHADHNNTKLAGGAYTLKNTEGTVNIHGINIIQLKTFHDKKNGKDRGPNLISIFEYDNFRMAHMGDIGTLLSDEDIKKIGRLDAIMIPVGGYYTVDAYDAWEIIRRLSPKIVIPMHYKTPQLDPKNPIDTIDKFVSGHSNITKLSSSTYEIDILNLPKEDVIIQFSPPTE